MSDADQPLRPLTQAAPEEMGDSVLGNHVVNVTPARHHPRARLENRHDARLLPLLHGGGQGDDRLAALALRRPADEIDLPAEPGVDPGPDGVRADLAGEVNLDGGVDGNQVVVARHHGGIVGVLGGVRLEERVVVYVLVEPLRAEDKRENRLPLVQGLLPSGDDPLFDRLHHAVAHHLGVDAEVALPLELGENRVRDAADTELEGGPIRYQLGDVVRDSLLHLGARLAAQLGKVDRRLHDPRQLGRVDERVAENTRHSIVDLGDDDTGAVGRRLGGQGLDAEAHEAVFVGPRHLDHGDIERDDPLAEEPRDLVEKDRHIVGAPLVDRRPVGRPDEETVVAEVPLHLRRAKRVLAEEQHVVELYPAQFVLARGQGVDQAVGDGGVPAVVDPVSVLDEPDRLRRRAELALVVINPRHPSSSRRVLIPGPLTIRTHGGRTAGIRVGVRIEHRPRVASSTLSVRRAEEPGQHLLANLPVLQVGPAAQRPGGLQRGVHPLVRQLDGKRKLGVVQDLGGHTRRVRGHVGDAVVHHVVHHERRIAERRRTARFHAAPLVDRDIDDHAPGLHLRDHFARDQPGSRPAGNEDGADHDIGLPEEAGYRLAVRQHRDDTVLELFRHQVQLGHIGVEDRHLRSGVQGRKRRRTADRTGTENEDARRRHAGHRPEEHAATTALRHQEVRGGVHDHLPGQFPNGVQDRQLSFVVLHDLIADGGDLPFDQLPDDVPWGYREVEEAEDTLSVAQQVNLLRRRTADRDDQLGAKKNLLHPVDDLRTGLTVVLVAITRPVAGAGFDEDAVTVLDKAPRTERRDGDAVLVALRFLGNPDIHLHTPPSIRLAPGSPGKHAGSIDDSPLLPEPE